MDDPNVHLAHISYDSFPVYVITSVFQQLCDLSTPIKRYFGMYDIYFPFDGQLVFAHFLSTVIEYGP